MSWLYIYKRKGSNVIDGYRKVLMFKCEYSLLCYRCDSKFYLYIGSLRDESLTPYYYLKLNFNQLKTKIKIMINY